MYLTAVSLYQTLLLHYENNAVYHLLFISQDHLNLGTEIQKIGHFRGVNMALNKKQTVPVLYLLWHEHQSILCLFLKHPLPALMHFQEVNRYQ